MKIKLISAVSILLLLSLLFTGCKPANKDLEAELEQKNEQINQLTEENQSLTAANNTLTEENTNLQAQLNNLQINPVLTKALAVLKTLKDKDMDSLSAMVHPTKGVRFTPYSNVNLQSDLVFTPQQLTGLLQSNQTYLWGEYDGSGDPIQVTFSDYYNRFVYDKDYANAHIIGNNVVIGKGNAINNIAQAYPQGKFIEFHFTGFDPQYDGMDWRSLSLVLEELNGTWYLVGIVHSEWTI